MVRVNQGLTAGYRATNGDIVCLRNDGQCVRYDTAGKELKVTKRGMVTWMTVPMHLTTTGKDGKTADYELRYTGIWEKRGARWVLVHEHISAPLS